MPKAGRAGTALTGYGEITPLVTMLEEKLTTRKTEKMFILTPDGEPVSERTQGRSISVSLFAEDVENLPGNVFLHNHPGAGSFLPADLAVAAKYRVKEARVVGTTPDGTRYLYRASGMKAGDAPRIHVRYDLILQRKIRSGPQIEGIRIKRTGRIAISTERAHRHVLKLMHETNQELASQFGYNYSRVRF